MSKIDFKKSLKHLYVPSKKDFSVVDVPTMNFVKIDGAGPPGNKSYVKACEWLFPISYGLKFMSKLELGRDYGVPPLEGLWWADDMSAFTQDRREEWKWTLMIMQPDWITNTLFERALEKPMKKQGSLPETLRFEPFAEGKCVQILHLGPFSEEGPTLARLHNEYMPQNGLTWNGKHHEIYLSDPRKSAPEKLRTVLRQPVKTA
ncbi:GyrI-like domain-containing protein [Planktotalea sp.]|uniref:GyrI-like domain-containing protein n=1 Tax=Planktotalea sp. TaxID=2029877 RepID=UPI003D6ABDE5